MLLNKIDLKQDENIKIKACKMALDGCKPLIFS